MRRALVSPQRRGGVGSAGDDLVFPPRRRWGGVRYALARGLAQPLAFWKAGLPSDLHAATKLTPPQAHSR